MSRLKRQTKKQRFRKVLLLGRIFIAAYFLFQVWIYVVYDINQQVISDEPSPGVALRLDEFKGSFSANRRPDSIDTTTFTSKAEIQRNTDVSVGYYNNPLERDLTRVPAYIEGSSNPPLFGYVMRDLANRFLSPSSFQQKRLQRGKGQFISSNILVACPGADALLSEIKKEKTLTIASKKELIKSYGYGIGQSFLVETIFHGHNVIPMDSNTGILDYHASKTSGILLAVLDPAPGKEDSVISKQLEESIRSGSVEYATFRVSSSISRKNLLVPNKKGVIEMQGIEPSMLFLEAGYKLQVLSSSHAPTDGVNQYGPNTLLKNVEKVERFLTFGSGLAQKAEFTRLSKSKLKDSTLSSKNIDTPVIFHSILFATRGLDLAIPSRKALLNLDRIVENDFVLNIEANPIPYPTCPRSSVKIERLANKQYKLQCFGTLISMDAEFETVEDGQNVISAEIWHSHTNLSLSEAVCAKCTKSVMNSKTKPSITESACKSMIPSLAGNSSKLSRQGRNGNQGPNLVAIELRGVSQAMLNTSLISLKNELRKQGLDYYPNYVQSTTIQDENDNRDWWALWDNDIIEGDGYQRYRGSNQCDPSLHGEEKTSTLYHGSQTARMLCFDYDRPNCLGGKSSSRHLMDNLLEFISARNVRNERWVSYLTLFEGTEESETLAGELGTVLSYCLRRLSYDRANTVVIIFSNDVEKPVLFLDADNDVKRLLKEQKTLFTSDLRLIVRSIMNFADLGSARYSHLVSEHPNRTTRDVKAKVRDVRAFNEAELAVPPSILSFYADIPKEHKYQLIKSASEQPTKRAKVFQGCTCATQTIPWIPCDIHPWEKKNSQKLLDDYILVDCPGHPIHLEINILRKDNLLMRSARRRAQSGLTLLDNVNIIFLEIDSVSQQYADRHFPKTRELLKTYRIKQNGENEYQCTNGICSAEFQFSSLVGANSIPNQVAALSGCISSTPDDLCGFDPKTYIDEGLVCDDPNSRYYGFRLQRLRIAGKAAYWCPDSDRRVTQTPWLFSISQNRGYINFFGEEFCYDYSPYVTQGNVFPKFYFDIQSHFVFCSLVDRKDTKVEKEHKWGVDISDPCLEGHTCHPRAEKASISLQYIQQMWDVYENQPKFAFLNAIAAHDYSRDWEKSIPKAEAYDEQIHNFLEAMLGRADSESTVIILRSDHGLQKGPTAVDFSVQFEHRRPWLEVLIPQSLVVSERALFNNQVRMLTGYDLYKTMRYLMSDRKDVFTVGEGIPDWSFDIISEEIDLNRTCEDAKVDPNLCRSEAQTRQFGVCNPLDLAQARFC